jgi:hypothetical protein
MTVMKKREMRIRGKHPAPLLQNSADGNNGATCRGGEAGAADSNRCAV